jgi:hypothetical protein
VSPARAKVKSEAVELIVPIDVGPAPYTLASASFLSALESVEAQTASLRITDVASAQTAATLQQRLTEAGKLLEQERVRLTQPFLLAQRKIAEVAKGPANRIEVAKSALKAALTNYDAEQRRLAAEEERKRQAELARLAAIRQKEIDAEEAKQREAERIQREAVEAARKAAPAAPAGMDLDDPEPVVVAKTAVQKQLETLQHAPVVAAPRPVGVTFRTTLEAVVVNVDLLPEPFITRTAKLAAIKATYCTGFVEGRALPVCPGVRFEVKREPIARGGY